MGEIACWRIPVDCYCCKHGRTSDGITALDIIAIVVDGPWTAIGRAYHADGQPWEVRP